MIIIFSVIIFLLGGIFRRLFGGWLSEVPIISIRFIQHLFGFAIGFYIFYPNFSRSLIIPIVIQGLFWAMGHGMCFDMGRMTDNTQKDMERYKKTIGYHFTEWLTPSRIRQSFMYDFILMFFRYTIPTIPLMYFNPYYIIIGIIISPIYALCWYLYDNHNKYMPHNSFIGCSTNLAEFVCGGFVYTIIYILSTIIY